MKKIQSTCNLCALACNLDFYVENGKIEKVSPTVDYPVNQGFCCIKGCLTGPHSSCEDCRSASPRPTGCPPAGGSRPEFPAGWGCRTPACPPETPAPAEAGR